MQKVLQRPYVFEAAIDKRWQSSVLFSVFVFLFLIIFRPFGLNTLGADLFKICLGYGLTTFLIMAVLNLVIPPLFPRYFTEEKWTVGRELFWNIFNIALIGLGNALYNNFVFSERVDLKTILLVESYTLAVGVFPISATIFIKEFRLNQKYKTKSAEINHELKNHPVDLVESPKTIILNSETANESLQIQIEQLIYIQSADNYLEVYYLEKQTVLKKLMRGTLKAVSESLVQYPELFRCHKSYLVNLNKVTRVSGNAQGYKLALSACENLIPVSRQLNSEIKNRLTTAP